MLYSYCNKGEGITPINQKGNCMNYLHSQNLSTVEMPFSKVPSYNELHQVQSHYGDDGGLYFIGLMTIDPQENHYYLIKVGQSKDVHKRLKQYFCYNPMIYNNNNVLYIPNEWARDIAENNCQAYISHFAYGIAAGGQEWFYVTKDVYFFLCSLFNDNTMFEFIAKGEVEGI